MKMRFCLAFSLVALFSVIHTGTAFAETHLNRSNIHLVKHFTYGGSHCGVGTDCFIDDDGEVQGMAITSRHIVIAHGINGGYGADGKVRVYFISRKTLKIEKMIPNKKNFSCGRLGDEGCYGHGSSAAYNKKTDKVWITAGAESGDTSFQFDDKTMKYEKQFSGIGSAKLTFNEKHNAYWTGSEGGGKLKDVNLKVVGTVNAKLADCVTYEEGPGSFGDYVVTNTYRNRCGSAKLRVYNYNNSNFIKEFIVDEDAIGTIIIEQVGFLEDGTMIMSIPKNNNNTSWGHGVALYAVSGKTMGVSKSTNVKMTAGGSGAKKPEPDVQIVPSRRIQCATILYLWCDAAEMNGEGTIFELLRFAISVMTVGLAVLGTIGIIYSAFIVMTAGGNVAQVTKAKQRILEIVVGIILWVLAAAVLDLFLPASEVTIRESLKDTASIIKVVNE